MKVIVLYYLNDKGRKAALLADKPAQREQKVTINDPQKRLGPYIEVDGDGNASLDLRTPIKKLARYTETVDGAMHERWHIDEPRKIFTWEGEEEDAPINSVEDVLSVLRRRSERIKALKQEGNINIEG